MARNDGLSTANFMSGAMQGYNFMQGIENNKLHTEEIQHQRGLRDADAVRRDEQHQAAMQTNQQQQEIQRRTMRKLDEEETVKVNQLVARKMIALQNNGLDWTQENQKSLEQYGRFADPEYLLAPETGSALDTVKSVLSGELNMNDPAALQAYNRLINVQRGASDGRTVSINRMVPAGSGKGVHLGLSVKNADGTAYDNGVLTQNRSTDPRDPVEELTMDELIEVMGAVEQTRGALSNPQMAKAFIQMYGPQAEKVSAKDQSQIDYNKSRAGYYDAKAVAEGAAAGGTASGKLPAKAQLHEYLKKEFPKATSEELWTLANSSPENPWDFVNKHIQAQNESDRMGKIPLEEKERNALAALQRVRGHLRPDLVNGGSQSPAASVPAVDPGGNDRIQQILAANPGKSPEWAAAYLKHISGQ